MTRVRFTDAGGMEFGFDIHTPDGKSVSVAQVFNLCNDYLRILVSMTADEYKKFMFSGGSMRIEFDTDDAKMAK